MVSVINNIEVVKIPFDKSTKIVYLPFNSNLQQRKIHKIIVAATEVNQVITDTYAALKVANVVDLKNSFITLKNERKEHIAKDVSLSEFFSNRLHTNYIIDQYLDTDNSFITFNIDPEQEGAKELLLYFLYGENHTTLVEPEKARTFFVPAGFNGKLSAFIHSNEVGNIKKITYTPGDFVNEASFFIQICEQDGRTFEYMSSLLFNDGDQPRKKDTFLFDGLYPDYDNSFIVNWDKDVYITFYY